MYYQWKKRVKIYIEILDNISVHYEYVAENITRKESAHWIIFFFYKLLLFRTRDTKNRPLSDRAASQPAPGHLRMWGFQTM